MNILKKMSFWLANKISIDFLKNRSPLNLLIPYHHLVSNEAVPYIEPLYKFKNVVQFEADLDYLLRRFKPIALPDLIKFVENGDPLPEKSFLLTFDDALKEVYEVAMPIMLKKGVPAALFIVPKFLDNKHLFYDLKKGLIINELLTRKKTEAVYSQLNLILKDPVANADPIKKIRQINYLDQRLTNEIGEILQIDFDSFLSTQEPFMSSVQVEAFIGKGFHVGAHSLDHPLYNLITVDEQVKQTVESIAWVTKRFKLSYKAFAFPHTDNGISDEFFNRILTDDEFKPDIIFGNRTGVMSSNPWLVNRFIGENPAISMETMSKAVLAYSMLPKLPINKLKRKN